MKLGGRAKRKLAEASPPARGRGLKPYVPGYGNGRGGSPPARGRGLKQKNHASP